MDAGGGREAWADAAVASGGEELKLLTVRGLQELKLC